MTPNARWPSVVEEMPGREFHVTGFQRVGWREKSSFNTFFHHIAAPCQGILSILEVFFCLIARTLYILKKCNTSLLFCDSRCHRLGSSVYKPSTDFGSTDPKHGQGGSRSRLRFQHRGKSWWPSAGPGQSEGSVMFAPHCCHSRPYHWKHGVCSEPRQPCASLWLLPPATAWWSQLHAVPPLRWQVETLPGQPCWMYCDAIRLVLAGSVYFSASPASRSFFFPVWFVSAGSAASASLQSHC